METIILASGSPRRQELLNLVRIPYKVYSPDIDENVDFSQFENVEERVKQIALKKIETVVSLFKQESPRWVLGLDTLVEFRGKEIRKPEGI